MIAPGERASPDGPATTDGHPVSRAALSPSLAPSDLDLPLSPDRLGLAAQGGQDLLAEFIRYGRQRPFEEIVRRYAGMVFNVCLRITKDKHEAEDATQAVFLTLAVQAKRGTEIKALGPWLQQVAKRLSLDVRRGKKRRQTREERHHDEQDRRRASLDAQAVPSPDLDELKTILHEELQKLPPKYRLPLILHYFGGMTRDEMAAELNCKPSTLGVRIFRAREMLAGRLTGRGVHMSAGAMAVAIGYLVRRAVTDGMVARTSQAAAALASGSANLSTVAHLLAAHEGAAGAAARVVVMTRRASHVLVIGKVRVTVAVAVLTATSLGAGVRAFALLPPIGMRDVQQLITNGVNRLVRPLVDPITRPMRADAGPAVVAPAAVPVATAVEGPGAWLPSLPPATVPTGPAPGGQAPASAGGSSPGVGVAPPSQAAPAVARSDGAAGLTTSPTASAAATDRTTANAAPAVASSESSAAGPRRGADPTVAARAEATPLVTASAAPAAAPPAASPPAAAASAGQDLYVPAAGSTAAAFGMTASPASQVQIVQVPAIGGSVTESNGVIRGYGKVARTGTLDVSGRVVADGNGVDRTLDLTGFSSVRVTAPSAGAAPTGFYAADHGRLILPLVPAPAAVTAQVAAQVASQVAPQAAAPALAQAAAEPSPVASAAGATAAASNGLAPTGDPAVTVLTWGLDPSATTLGPVNSVRLVVLGGDEVPAGLSLLAPDRSDAPAIPAADGAPLALWSIDTGGDGPVSSVNLAVRYDDNLVAELGGDESAVRLYTLADAGDAWQPVVDAASVDVADHIVSGSASDVAYFAVTVPPAADVDVAQLVAHPQAELASPGVVPEPTALAAAATAVVGLLGRRRRRRR